MDAADLRDLFRNDNAILDKLDRVEQRPVGNYMGVLNIVKNTYPQGNTKDAGLRRLSNVQ